MKNIHTCLVLLSCLLLAAACHPNDNNSINPANRNWTAPIVKQRLWSGNFLDTISYHLAPSYNRTITDSQLTIARIDDSAVLMPYFNITLKFAGADSITHTLKYMSDESRFSIWGYIYYYYLTDSMTFTYEQYFPVERPEAWLLKLHSTR